MRETKTIGSILDIKMAKNDSGAKTIRGYLKKMLEKLWGERDEFSGKRPFGNSGWDYDLYGALITNGVIDGGLDENGCILHVTDLERKKADQLIFDAIASL